MDPNNPRVLYAGFWQVVRRPWELVSGGPGSSLCKSTDGGDTWKKTDARGQRRAARGHLGEGRRRGLGGRSPGASTPSSRRRRGASSSARTAARSGSTSTTSTRSASAPGTTRGSIRTRRTRTRSTCRTSTCTGPPTAGRASRTCRVPHGDNHDLWIDPDDPGPDDPRQRRRRDDHVQRRQDLVHAEQPADRAVLPGRRRTTGFRTGSTARSRTTRASRSRRGVSGRGHRLLRLALRSAAARAAGSRRRPRTPTSSTPASTAGRSPRYDHRTTADARDHGLAAARRRARDEGPEVPLPVERADPDLAARPDGPVPRLADPPAQRDEGETGRRCRRT